MTDQYVIRISELQRLLIERAMVHMLHNHSLAAVQSDDTDDADAIADIAQALTEAISDLPNAEPRGGIVALSDL